MEEPKMATKLVITRDQYDTITAATASGTSWRALGAEYGCSYHTVQRAYKVAEGAYAVPAGDANGQVVERIVNGATTFEDEAIATLTGRPVLLALPAADDDEDLAETIGRQVRETNTARRAEPVPAPAEVPAGDYPHDEITARAEKVIAAGGRDGARLSGKTNDEAGTVNARTARMLAQRGPFELFTVDDVERIRRA
jgi:DNA-binding transcriptional regulator YhcF (GntR family)